MSNNKDVLSMLQSRIALRANFLAAYNATPEWPAVDDPEQRMYSKELSVDGVVKEVDRSPFGNAVTTVYDELAVGYHLHLAAFGAKQKNW